MKVYAIITYPHQTIKIKSFESLEKERTRLVEEYYNDKDNFLEFLDNHYLPSDFYKKEPNEEEIDQKFKEYCESCARYDTFGQYKEIEVE